MIYRTGSIFDSACDLLVNPVNTRGVSGAGLAAQFAQTFPEQQKRFESVARSYAGNFTIGTVMVLKPVVYLPTKAHWKHPSTTRIVQAGLYALRYELVLHHHSPKTVAIPQLGCGLGRLAWPDVHALILEILAPLEHTHEFHIYGPKPG